MPSVAIDLDQVRAEASSLIAQGNATYDTALRIDRTADELRLGSIATIASTLVERVTTDLWRAGVVLQVVADAAERGDILDRPGIEEIGERADQLVRSSPRPRWWGGFLPALPTGRPFSAMGGDLGGTYHREPRAPFTIFGTDGVARGRALITRALADTADLRQIRADEFELVQIDDERFVVVLPGVTDLSRPDLGLSDDHRSVRDLDRHAVASARSTSIDDNRYAEMVMEALDRAGVPDGSRLLVIGHSFGADAAVDLAADDRFNGERYHVTHVVAAGYHLPDRHVADIPASTEALVIQNDRDLAVIAERAGHRSVEAAVDGGRWVADRARGHRGALVAAWDVLTDMRDAVAGRAEAASSFVGALADDLVDVATGADHLPWHEIADVAVEHVQLEPRLERLDGHVVVDVFDGGRDGFGHHPSNYVEHLEATGDEPIVEFFESIADSGYARSATAVAIDVSVPADR